MRGAPPEGDWQKKPGRLFLLANFIRPSTIKELSVLPNLREILGEPPEHVADELIEAGVLEFVDPNESSDQVFSRVTVAGQIAGAGFAPAHPRAPW
jgi:hypothetical protein